MSTGKADSRKGLDAAHDPGCVEARTRADGTPAPGPARVRIGGTDVLFGTAGWTDKTLTAPGVFYPNGATSAEARLRYYASRFPLVEVDSTYYALPARRMAELWAERTPADFRFDVKAFALMTGHATELDRLPREIQDALPPALVEVKRAYPKDLPREVRSEVWRWFADALTPLHEAGKLGAVFLQYPPWVQPSEHAAPMLERARERLGELPIAVEFRHRDWMSPTWRERILGVLRELGMSYVIVDAPQGMASSMPPDVEIPTRRLAVVRMHGRRADTWERRGAPVLERFRYLYEREELVPWARRVAEMAGQAEQVHVVFNNCYGNYGTTNALEMAGLMREAGGGGRKA